MLIMISIAVVALIVIGMWLFVADPIPTLRSMSPLSIICIIVYALLFLALREKLLTWARSKHQKTKPENNLK